MRSLLLNRLSPLFVIFLLLTIPVHAQEILAQPGWDRLIHQQTASADSTFNQVLKTHPNSRDALLGKAILASYQGDFESVFEDYLSIVLAEPDNAENEAYFRRMSEFEMLAPHYPKLRDTYEKLLQIYNTQPLHHPYLRTVASEYLTRIYYAEGEFQKAKSLEDLLGYITKWDYVLGPFGKTGMSDLNQIFSPEEDLSLDHYPGWVHPVSRHPITVKPYLGQLNLNDTIYPNNGTAYAVTEITVSQDTDGWIGLSSNSLAKVWMGGKVVLIRDYPQTQLTGTSWSPVHLQKGWNQVVVKLVSQNGNMNFRLQVLDNAGSPIPLLPNSTLNNDSLTTLNPSQTTNTYIHPPFSYSNDSAEELTAQLSRAMLAIENKNFAEGESILLRFQKKYPDWGYPNLLLADLYLRQSENQPASALRLTNQAKELYERVKSQMPDTLGPYRGLAWYYIHQRQFDTALDYAKQAEKIASNSYLVSSLLGEIYSQRGFEVETEQAWAKCTALNPRYAEAYSNLAGWKEKNGLYKEIQPLNQYIYDLDQTNWNSLEQLRRDFERQGNYAASQKLLQDYYANFSMNFQGNILLGELSEKLNQPQKAVEYYSKATEFNPDHPAGYEHLAEFALLQSDTTKAISLFQKALYCAPHRDDIQDRVRLLLGQKDFYEPYDVVFETVDTTGYDSGTYPRAAVIYLLDLAVSVYHPDGSERTMVHQAVKILNKQGRERFEEISIPSNATVILARTITKDGKIYKPTLITQTSSGKTLSMYAVEEGTIVEYTYVYNEGGGGSPVNRYTAGEFYYQEKEDVMALSRSVFIVPDGVLFQYHSHPADFLPTISVTTPFNSPSLLKEGGGGGQKVYLWEKRKSPGIRDEPFMPPMEDISVNNFESTYPNWESVILPILDHVREDLVPSSWISETAKSLISSATTDKEKVQKIYDFVSQKITSDNSGGATVTDILLIGSGSMREKTLLAKALLDAVQIKSELMLVTTEDIPEIQSGIPQPGQFTRPLLYLPDKPGGFEYLDFSSQYRPAGHISESIQGKAEIRLSSNGFGFYSIPDYSQTELGTFHQLVVTVLKDSTCRVTGKIVYYGDNAVSLRDYLNDPIRKKRTLDEEINRLFRGIEISTSAWNGLNDLTQPVSLTFEGKVSNLLTPNTEGFTFTPLLDKLSLSRYVPAPQREYPLQINDAIAHGEYELELNLPDTIQVGGLPSELLEVSPYGNYELHWTPVTQHQWIGKRSVLIPKLKIKKDQYPDFLDFCQKIDSLEKQQLHLIWVK